MKILNVFFFISFLASSIYFGHCGKFDTAVPHGILAICFAIAHAKDEILYNINRTNGNHE